MARHQTAGRGRRGRSWLSGQGDLTASLLLTLDKPPLEAAQLAFVAALAVSDLLDAYVSPELVSLKWPNDALIEGRKAAGILIESGPAAHGGLWLAVGIGVNLSAFPQDVEHPATAIGAHLSPAWAFAPSQDDAMQRLATAFADRLNVWLTQGFAPVRAAWAARATGMGRDCQAKLSNETVSGVAEGLDEDGALLIRLPDRALRRITAGDVFFGMP